MDNLRFTVLRDDSELRGGSSTEYFPNHLKLNVNPRAQGVAGLVPAFSEHQRLMLKEKPVGPACAGGARSTVFTGQMERSFRTPRAALVERGGHPRV